ncbi:MULTISPECIES: AAA family ATPase [unclassified Geodermatophilus]|uniref:AAA family ATPase n=1 Tax=unclassified Geodermatophilus TaxID=2637632 RepID=UPI003EF00D79
MTRGFARYGPGLVPEGPPPVDDRPLGLDDLGKLARRGVRAVTRAARADDQVSLAGLLAGHLGEGGIGEDVVEETWPAYEHVNVQAGLDAWLAARTSELVGVVNFRHRPFGLAELVAMAGQPADPYGPRPGNAATVNLPCGPDGETRACLRCAVHLVEDGDGVRTALLVRAAEPETGLDRVSVQALSTSAAAARAAVRDIRAAAERENVFRGQVLSFGAEVFGHGQTLLQFHRRPHLAAGQLVLPASTLGEVERQVVDVARHRVRLLAAGQHLKRGLLLYGPPGVGKTHTVRYLIGRLPGTTVVELTGGALHLIAEACSVARTLQPALIVVEDVDLIAEDRGMHPGHHPLLFQLLNEMDGLAEDADVVFLLTTNRADLLEPALAARPGRVDQAVELTLPDRDARRALFDLYRGRLEVDVSGLEDVLDRTDGVTASFLKELIRRAALFAAERTADGELSVSAGDLTSALDELLDTRNAMTRTLLGAATR